MYLATQTRQAPLGRLRALPARPSRSRRRRHVQPQTTLGSGGPIVVTSVSTGVGAGTSAGLTAAAGALGIGGAAVGTIVPIVGSIVGALIGGLLSAHYARVKGAQNENAALNQVIPAVMQDIQTVVSAYNAGQISAQDAVTALQSIQQNYWQAMGQYEAGPGQAGGPQTCNTSGSSTGAAGTPMTHTVKCDKAHTASTCVGCIWVENWVDQLSQLISAGKVGTFQLQVAIPGNGYGFTGASALSVTLKTPPPVSQVGSAISSAGYALASGNLAEFASLSIYGIPVWAIALGGVGLLLFWPK